VIAPRAHRHTLSWTCGTTVTRASLRGMPKTIIRSDLETWDELEEDDRNVIRERIAEGELPSDFRVSRHRFYVGGRVRHLYLDPEPLRRSSR
jgi:hypothetical protein